MTVELINAGTWHDSIGDLAVMELTATELAKRGVPSIPRLTPSGERTCVIGGGALFTCNRQGAWWNALRTYRVSGKHILNGVSIRGGDFRHLERYRYVSVRDQQSYEHIADVRPDASVAPCVTVLADPPDIGELRTWPTYEFLDELLDTEYIVVDAGLPPLDLPMRTVVADTRPWERRDVSPLWNHRNLTAILAVLYGAKAVYCCSLHLSILALAVGTPFVYYESKPNGKGMAYWRRANMQCVVTYTVESLPHILQTFAEFYPRWREAERGLAAWNMDRIVEAL